MLRLYGLAFMFSLYFLIGYFFGNEVAKILTWPFAFIASLVWFWTRSLEETIDAKPWRHKRKRKDKTVV